MDPLPFRLGYATSGFAHHRLDDALRLLAATGYRAVSLTLDVHHLNPYEPELPRRVEKTAALLRALDLAVVVETGARFLLDPARKHRPTLLCDEGSERRAEFLGLALAVARDLGADCLSCWSGAKPAALPDAEAWSRLEAGVAPLVAAAQEAGVDVAFEPEPGMFVATVAQWNELDLRLGRPARFGLAFDVGHALANDEGDPAALLREHAPRLVTVAVEDMRRGVHDHLMFGDGHLDLPAVVDALEAVGFSRVVSIELPRHAHDAPRIAARCADLFAALGADVRPRA
jgi:L-ribulose-5-phosphate 3-epimerase